MSALERELRGRFGDRLLTNASLAEFTSFRIGGPADLLITVETESELIAVLEAAHRHAMPAFCLGAGTNLLISDRGVRGLVVRLGQGFSLIEIASAPLSEKTRGVRVTAGAAAPFGSLVETVVERGLEGLEFGEGIPGTVGGGLVMNAGAFGGEIARVVRLVHGITAEGRPRALSTEEAKFAYRRTDLPQGFIITRVDFELAAADREQLRAKVGELRARRAARQPLAVPNAGSIFKNPPGAFAGRLLEGAGLKGRRLGGAAFSERHANFIVNLGGARADEVLALIELARNQVRETSGVLLETEVRLVGEW